MKLVLKSLLCGLLLTLPLGLARAQTAPDAPDAPRAVWVLDVAAGRLFNPPATFTKHRSDTCRTQFSAAGWRYWAVGVRGRLRLGAGARLTYGRAPALWLGRQDYAALVEDSFQIRFRAGNPEALRLNNLRQGALNVALAANWRPNRWLRAGLSIDVAGLNLGSRQQAETLHRDPRDGDYFLSTPAPGARPQRGNLLLIGKRDRGFLNSEFYVGAALGHGLEARLGLSHLVTNYIAGGRRYQAFQTLGFVGLTYEL